MKISERLLEAAREVGFDSLDDLELRRVLERRVQRGLERRPSPGRPYGMAAIIWGRATTTSSTAGA